MEDVSEEGGGGGSEDPRITKFAFLLGFYY